MVDSMDKKSPTSIDERHAREPDWLGFGLNARWKAMPPRGLVEKLVRQFPGLPSDYIALLRRSNGADVENIGIWDVDFVIEMNEGRPDDEAGGLFLFASQDETRYGFDLRRGCRTAVVSVGEWVSWECATYEAPTFSELLRLTKLEWEWMEADMEADDVIDATPAVAATALNSQEPIGHRDVPPASGGILALLKRFVPARRV